jgi:hypothetical protein
VILKSVAQPDFHIPEMFTQDHTDDLSFGLDYYAGHCFFADAAMEHRFFMIFPVDPRKKGIDTTFLTQKKDEFSIARDSSGFIEAQKEAQLMWRFDAVLYQSAVCIAAFKESS